jgi:hypothetical protein
MRVAQVALAIAAVLGAALAALLYLPWHATPFDILDFSEFLPFLTQHDGLRDRLDAFLQYYATHGRLNAMSYLMLIAKWRAFGWDTVGWQVSRWVQMCAIVWMVYLLLRGLGAGRGGSVAGASLFIVAGTAAPGWIRLTMGEPLAMVAILTASLIALRYRFAARYGWPCAAIVLLLMAAVLSKEILVALVPFVIAIALCADGAGELRPPKFGSRERWLIGATAFGILVTMIPIVTVAHRAVQHSADAYAAGYGRAPLTIGRFFDQFGRILLPMRPAYAADIALPILPANLLFMLLLCAGWVVVFGTTKRSHWLPLGGWAVGLVVCGAAIYLPWPVWNEFYGLPFLLGSATLIAVALTVLAKHSLVARGLSYSAMIAVIAMSAMASMYEARTTQARREVNHELAELIAASPRLDSVVVAMPWVSEQRWQGVGPTLRRYAEALHPGTSLPRVSDELCRATIPMYQSGAKHALLVTYTDRCGGFPNPTRTVRRYFSYVSWQSFRTRADSVRADLLSSQLPK